MTESFLDLVFGRKPPEAWMYFWTLTSKKSSWHQDLTQAQKRIDASHLGDLYLGVGLSPKNYGPNNRCPAREIAGLMGLWLDLDVAGPAHKKAGLPPTKDAALAWIRTLPKPPTLTVDSGHGYQCWWLFVEPWLFATPEENTHAEAVSRGWNLWLQGFAGRSGWAIDSTWDLARILRVPGTTNTKVAGAPEPVTLLDALGPRYSPSDFEEYLGSTETPQSLSSEALDALAGSLDLRADADVSVAKLQALLDIDPKFKATWDGKRKDFKDSSPSTYDMALAHYTAGAGWTPQEIANLIISWRRRFGHDLKLRQDYYALTIGKAITATHVQRSSEALEEYAALSDGHPPQNGARADLLHHVSSLLGFEVSAVTHVVADPDVYTMTIAGRELTIGAAEVLDSQPAFRRRLMDATSRRIPEMNRQTWHNVCSAILGAAEITEADGDATSSGRALALLDDYLAATNLPEVEANDEVYDDRLTSRVPVRSKDAPATVLLSSAHLRQWCLRARQDRYTTREIALLLRAAGAAPASLNTQGAAGWKTFRLWSIRWR